MSKILINENLIIGLWKLDVKLPIIAFVKSIMFKSRLSMKKMSPNTFANPC
jgi:hypothetical protein